jgi:hypothetical protein
MTNKVAAKVEEGELDEGQGLDFSHSAENVNTIFFDTCSSAIRAGSTIRMALVEYALSPDGSPFGKKGKHVVNLVVSVEGFHNMMNFLNEVQTDQISQAEANDK